MFVKASLTHLGTLESLTVQFNPNAYRVDKVMRYAAPAVFGSSRAPLQFVAGGGERFAARLLLDATVPAGLPAPAEAAVNAGGPSSPEAGTDPGADAGSRRDLRDVVRRLESWGDPDPDSWLPPKVLFSWGDGRFHGHLEELNEEWIRFDADGTPVRAWLDVVLRR